MTIKMWIVTDLGLIPGSMFLLLLVPVRSYAGQVEQPGWVKTCPIRNIQEIQQTQATPMTLHGVEKLREELDFLKSIHRLEIIAAIVEAREHSDLRENVEYHAVREQQGFCKGRIRDIEARLSNAQVADVTKVPNNGHVIFGVTAAVLNLDSGKEQTCHVVDDDETDLKQNLISVDLPIARGLVGKEEDDVVVIRAPSDEVEFGVIKVEYL